MVCVLLMSFFNKHERKAGGFHFSFAGKCGWERGREGEKKLLWILTFQFSTKILSKATNKNLWENVERVGQYTHRHTNMYISMKRSSIWYEIILVGDESFPRGQKKLCQSTLKILFTILYIGWCSKCFYVFIFYMLKTYLFSGGKFEVWHM